MLIVGIVLLWPVWHCAWCILGIVRCWHLELLACVCHCWHCALLAVCVVGSVHCCYGVFQARAEFLNSVNAHLPDAPERISKLFPDAPERRREERQCDKGRCATHRPALPSPPNRSPPRPPPRRHGWHPWGRCGTGPPALNRMSAGTAPVGPGPARPRGGPIRQPGPHRRELCRRRAPSPAAGRAGRAGCGGHRGGARALLLGSVRRGRVDSDGRPTCPCYLSTEESVRRRIVETDARQLWVLSGTGMAAGKMRRISRRAGVNAPARESACGLSSRRSPLFALLSLLPIRHSPLCTCSFVRFHTHPKQRD